MVIADPEREGIHLPRYVTEHGRIVSDQLKGRYHARGCLHEREHGK